MFIKQAKGEKPDVDVDQDKEEKEPSEVVQRLTEEAEAAFEQARKPRFRFSDEEVRWMADMMEKHGDDFKVVFSEEKRNSNCNCLYLLLPGNGQGPQEYVPVDSQADPKEDCQACEHPRADGKSG